MGGRLRRKPRGVSAGRCLRTFSRLVHLVSTRDGPAGAAQLKAAQRSSTVMGTHAVVLQASLSGVHQGRSSGRRSTKGGPAEFHGHGYARGGPPSEPIWCPPGTVQRAPLDERRPSGVPRSWVRTRWSSKRAYLVSTRDGPAGAARRKAAQRSSTVMGTHAMVLHASLSGFHQGRSSGRRSTKGGPAVGRSTVLPWARRRWPTRHVHPGLSRGAAPVGIARSLARDTGSGQRSAET